jgi:GDP-D-mannose dehydratase
VARQGVDEQGIDAATGKVIVKIDPRARADQVETLLGMRQRPPSWAGHR